MTTMTDEPLPVTGGVDTHRDVHVAAVLDARSAELGVAEFATTPAGYRALLEWVASFGPVDKIGVEGTGSYGKGLSRYLTSAGVAVVEVDRPNRQDRRLAGKSDAIDAIAAARATQGGKATAIAKTSDGPVEQLRILRIVRQAATEKRTRAINQLRALIVTAPDGLRADLDGRPVIGLCQHVAKYRIVDPTTPQGTLKSPSASRILTSGCAPDLLDAPRLPLRRLAIDRRLPLRLEPLDQSVRP